MRTGILVKSYEGRPIKIEGNPQHPASLGGTNPFIQASILSLYDPERSQVVRHSSGITTWEDFVRTARTRLDSLRPAGGAGLRLLTGTVTSPTLGEQIRTLLKQFPQAKWHAYEPVSRDNTREGARIALGQEAESLYRFDGAEVILSLDCDFLFSEPGSLRYARDFSNRRRVRGEQAEINRLYVAEPTPSITGSMADHRLAIAAGRIGSLAQAVARRLGAKQSGAEDAQELAPYKAWIDTVAADLQQHRGSSLVIAGEFQPPQVHALAHSMNQLLGNVGTTVVYAEPAEESSQPPAQAPSKSSRATWRKALSKRCSSSALTQFTAHRRICVSPRRCLKFGSARISANMKMRPRRYANGMFRKLISWKPGAMPEASTAS